MACNPLWLTWTCAIISRMRSFSLIATALICGFCMMALEILGGRLLQPAFGSSIDVWAAIISVFILSLSVGYVIGGRVADRVRTSRALGWTILLAGVFYLFLPVYAQFAIERLGPAVHEARWGSLVASLILFLPPSLLLGCVSPLLVTLAVSDLARVGRTTGLLYAISCVGNVMGVLVADYALLICFTLNANLLGLGLCLGVTGLAHIAWPLDRRG